MSRMLVMSYTQKKKGTETVTSDDNGITILICLVMVKPESVNSISLTKYD